MADRLQAALLGDDAAELERALKVSTTAAGTTDASLLRAGVLKLATLQKSKPSPPYNPTAAANGSPPSNRTVAAEDDPPSNPTAAAEDDPPSKPIAAADGARHLADWLAKAQLNDMVIDRTMDTLMSEDVFAFADLVLFSSLSRFDQVLTAVTAKKIRDALGRDGHAAAHLPPSPNHPNTLVPPSPCASDGIPDWLNDAAAVLEKKPLSPPTWAAAAAADEPITPGLPLPKLVVTDEVEAETEQATAGPKSEQGDQPPLCKFFMRGTCLRGDACKFHHPTGGEAQSHGVNALTGLPLAATDGHSSLPYGSHPRAQSPGPYARAGSPRRRGSPRRNRRSASRPREHNAPNESAPVSMTTAAAAARPEGPTINSLISEAIRTAEEAAAADAGSTTGLSQARGKSPFRSQSFKRRQQRRAAAERRANEEQQDPNSEAL